MNQKQGRRRTTGREKTRKNRRICEVNFVPWESGLVQETLLQSAEAGLRGQALDGPHVRALDLNHRDQT